MMPLVLYGASSVVLYAMLVRAFPLTRYAEDSRLYDLAILLDKSTADAVAYALIVTLLFVAYVRAWFWLRNRERESTGLAQDRAIIIVVAVLACALLTWMYPIGANDLFTCFFRSRTFVYYGGNPFLDPPVRYWSDPYAYMAGGWGRMGSPYGPAWELLSALAHLVAGGQLVPGLVALKVIALLAFGGCIVLTASILEQRPPRHKTSGMLFLAWNPLLLIEWIGNGHNDAVMMLFVLLGIWMWARGKYVWVLPALVLAAMVKAIAILLIPVFLADVWRAQSRPSARLRWLAATGLASAGIIVTLFAPFEGFWRSMSGLWQETTQRSGYSLVTTLALGADEWGLSNLFPSSANVARYAAYGSIAVLCIWQWIRVWHRRQNPIAAGTRSLWTYICLTPSFRMWYPAWAVALTPLLSSQKGHLHAIIACMTAELSVLIYSYLAEWSILKRYLWGVPFTLLLPILASQIIARAIQKERSGTSLGDPTAATGQTG